ncbi:hypothetical protein N9Z03_02250 [Akkermansiaceae bacterium]|nr:hypothetical protein [Akkermansiaceae bacterium]
MSWLSSALLSRKVRGISGEGTFLDTLIAAPFSVGDVPSNAEQLEPFVKDYLKQTLKDPDSYEAVSWDNFHSVGGGKYSVSHTYRAKNSFGGFNLETQSFIYSRKTGKIRRKD